MALKRKYSMVIDDGFEIVLRGNVKRFIESEMPGSSRVRDEEIIHASYGGLNDKEDYELVIRRWKK